MTSAPKRTTAPDTHAQPRSAPQTENESADIQPMNLSSDIEGADVARLAPPQRQSVIRNLGQRVGNQALQRRIKSGEQTGVQRAGDASNEAAEATENEAVAENVPDRAVMRTPIQVMPGRGVIQRTLREDAGGDWAAALLMIKSTSDEIFGQQIRATNDFIAAARGATPPFEETVMQGLIEAVIGAAFGGIGTVLKAAATRALTRTMVRAELAAIGTAINEGEATLAMTTATEGIIDTVVGSGKTSTTSAVSAAVSTSRAAGGDLLETFRSSQENALITLKGNQERQFYGQLGRLRSTTEQYDEWVAANAIYSGLMAAKDAAHGIQYNKLTDLWFTRQVTSIGGGVRPGMLRIYLRDRYPNSGTFSISGANLSGEGSADAIRAQLATRSLKDIEIPKWISMNGSMGYGILDCMWDISVNGGVTFAGPTISAPRPMADRLVEGEQRPQSWNGNRWGRAWLAAYNLGLQDLPTDDARNNDTNQGAAVRSIWDQIKNLTPGSIGNSSWS